MTKTSATIRRAPRPALSDRAARKVLDLARQLHDDTPADTVDSLVRRACRAVGIKPSVVAAQRFGAFALLQQEWDERVLRVMSPVTADWQPPPEDARPSADILNEAVAALEAFCDSDDETVAA